MSNFRETVGEWSKRCQQLGITLEKSKCRLCQLHELEGFHDLHSLSDIQLPADISLMFVIKFANWSAKFSVDFSLDRHMHVSDSLLLCHSIKDANPEDIILIEEKGRIVWNIAKELIAAQ